MCRNPFGGYGRLDKVEVTRLAGGSCEPMALVMRATILEAVGQYLFFGLGRNGTTPDEFVWAHEYLFAIRADQPETWRPAREMKLAYLGPETGRVRRTLQLNDDELRSMTLCRQYELAGLDRAMDIGRFRRLLSERRRDIVTANRSQINRYLGALRESARSRSEFATTAPGDLVETLVSPSDLGALAGLLYPQRPQARPEHRSPFSIPRRHRGRREWAAGRARNVTTGKLRYNVRS